MMPKKFVAQTKGTESSELSMKIIDLGDARLLTGQTNSGRNDDGGDTSWDKKI